MSKKLVAVKYYLYVIKKKIFRKKRDNRNRFIY